MISKFGFGIINDIEMVSLYPATSVKFQKGLGVS